MPTTEHKAWCLHQAIEIVKHAPSDNYPVHDRLKRTYKRLLALHDDAHETAAAKQAKDAKKKPAKA